MKPTIKELDKLWTDAVKARAGEKSEWSGKERDEATKLAGHHTGGRSCYALRWDLSNGVCITCGEHKFIAHHSGRAKKFRDWALKLRGINEDYLAIKGGYIGKTDLWAVKEYLKWELKRWKGQK